MSGQYGSTSFLLPLIRFKPKGDNTMCEPITLALPGGLSIECECAQDVLLQVAALEVQHPDSTIRVACKGGGLVLSVVDKPEELGPAFQVHGSKNTRVAGNDIVTYYDKDGKPL